MGTTVIRAKIITVLIPNIPLDKKPANPYDQQAFPYNFFVIYFNND